MAWNIAGYYGRTVERQADEQQIPDIDDVLITVHDITSPLGPRTLTVIPGHIIRSTREALLIVANYGMFGHTYQISGQRADRTTFRYTIAL